MLYVNMALGSSHGWGVCGKYIARELARLEPVRIVAEPFLMSATGDPLEFHELQSLMLSDYEAARLATVDGARVVDGPLLQGIGDQRLLPRRLQLRGRATIGYTFFENNLLQAQSIENGRRYFDRVAAGSSWGARVLTEAGLPEVATVIQGVDPKVFYPAVDGEGHREFLTDEFVVFSGGKFELRKGQDVVIRAYKVLQDRHPDALLINAWFNPWPAIFETMRHSCLIRFAPWKGPFIEAVNRVLADNGIDLQRVVTCPQQLNLAMARIYRNTDVGLFPNRCEGGTNLVLMEYLACGKPVVAVDTTGHADIISSSNALIIGTKGETTIHDNDGVPVARWPEPDLDDAIDKLEWAYQHRDSMRELGRQAGRDLAQRTWRKTAEAFHKIIHETFRGARPWPARGQRDAASQPSSATAASPASLSPHAKLAGS
ncbi:MAG: glycosyltransferase family 4 protein [Limisphaerales bacterium]